MMLTAFTKALAQAGDPRFRRVLILGVGLTVGMLVAATAGFVWLVQGIAGETSTLPLLGEVAWLDDLLGWAGLGMMLVLSTVLMVPVASALTSVFLDEVAQAVEDRHYPDLPAVPRLSWGDALRDTVGFLGVLIAANALALILYIAFVPAAPFIFWGLNGYLLGVEYFQLVAMRRIGRSAAKTMRRRYRWRVWSAGTLMAIPLSVPLINLLIPIFGAATFTHLFHDLQTRETAAPA